MSYKTNIKGFTLIELMTVVFIILILSSIGFFSFTSHIMNARDSSRISELSNIETTLQSYKSLHGTYPLPNNYTDINYNGVAVWNQGTFGKSVSDDVDGSEVTLSDPLTKSEYTYSTKENRKEYQLGSVLEGNDLLSKGKNPDILEKTYAAGNREGNAFVVGNYNGQVLTAMTGGVMYILAVPSIITNDLSDTNLVNIINNKKLVYNKNKNLPSSYTGTDFNTNGGFNFTPNNLVIFSGSISYFNDEYNRLLFLKALKEAYSGSVTLLNDKYLNFLNSFDISLTMPTQETKDVACDLIALKLKYPIKCPNLNFQVFYLTNSTSLDNINFNGMDGQSVFSVWKDIITGNLRFGTDVGVSLYNTGSTSWINYNKLNTKNTIPNSNAMNGITTISQTPAGMLLFGTDKGLLYTTDPNDPNNWQIKNNNFPGSSKQITSIYSTGTTVWVGVETGIAKLSSTTLATQSQALTSDATTSLITDNVGNLRVASKDGLIKYNVNNLSQNVVFKETTTTTIDPMPEHEINSVFKDSIGQIWGLTKKGVVKIIPTNKFTAPYTDNFVAYRKDNSGLIWEDVRSGFEYPKFPDPGAAYRFGTTEGVIIKYDGNNWETLPKKANAGSIYEMYSSGSFQILWSDGGANFIVN